MFVRFHRDYWEEDKNRSFGNDVNGIILNRINRGLAMDQVYVFSPSFLFNFRYGFTQQEFPERRVSQGFDLASLGFSPNLVSQVDTRFATIPRTTIGSLTALSSWETGDGTTASLTHSFVGNFTYLRGAHNMRFGPEYRVYREFRNRFPTDVSPDLNFSNAWARGPLDNSVVAPVGTEMVAMLLGIPGGSMTRSGSYAEQDQYFGLYFQDDWKISNKLTVNLGMRVEHETPITERFDRSATRFFGTTANPIQAQAQANYARSPIPELPVSAFQVLGGLGFANVGGQPRSYWDGQALGWMPRIGVAYQIMPKTVFRAGYGIFIGSIGVNKTNSNLTGFSQSTPIQASLDNGLNYIATLENPLPNGLIPPPGASGGLLTNLNQGLSFYPEKRNMPYAQRWSLGIQQELPGGFMVENSYVGNRGVRLTTNPNINNTPAGFLSTSPVRDQTTINFLSANVDQPVQRHPGSGCLRCEHFPREPAAALPALRRHQLHRRERLLVVPFDAGPLRKAILQGLHAPDRLHMVKGDGSRRVSQLRGPASVRVHFELRPQTSRHRLGPVGTSLRQEPQVGRQLESRVELHRGRLADQRRDAAAERCSTRLRPGAVCRRLVSRSC